MNTLPTVNCPLSTASKPRTAVLISGHMRTFARTLGTIRHHVLRHFPGADFFISTIRDADIGSIDQLRALYPAARIEVDIVAAQPELPIPVPPYAEDWTLGRMYGHEPYGISVHPQAILRQLWQLNRCWEHYTRCLGTAPGTVPCVHDMIIRLRPDSWFRSFNPHLALGPLPFALPPRLALTPWWGRFGGINDRFALLGPVAAEAYFTTYARLSELLAAGCPLHPESLIKASLEAAGCKVDDTLLVEFSKLYGPESPKLNGTFRDPEITMIDMAHLSAKSPSQLKAHSS